MKNIVTEKRCRKCDVVKSSDLFYKSKISSDGLYSYCKECKDKNSKKYLLENSDKSKKRRNEYNKKWYQDNKERKNRQSIFWRILHPEETKIILKKSREKHKEERNKRRSIERALSPEKHREKCREWSKANPENERVRSHNKRARTKGCEGRITVEEWLNLKNKHNNTCLCCGRKEPEIKLTLDHVIPIFYGGKNVIENAQPLCSSCNSSKGIKIRDYR